MEQVVRKNIPALTGIRGVAAVLVLLFHLPPPVIFGLEQHPIIVRNGNYGVDLFFILSGFILFHVHGDEFSRSVRTSAASFAVARIVRVFPLHLAVLAAIVPLVLLLPEFVSWFRTLGGQTDAFSFAGFVQTLTLTNGIGLPNLGQWNAPSWSLSAELVGYALFPLLAFYINKCGSVTKCLIVTIASLGLYCVTRLGLLDFSNGLIRMGTCFISGLALSKAYHLRPQQKGASALGVLGMIVSMLSLSFDPFAPFSVVGFALVIFAIALGGNLTERLFSSRAVLFLGEISFSLYLSHFILQAVILWAFFGGSGEDGNPIVALSVLLGASFLVALLFYYSVEKPSHIFGRQLAKRVRSAESLKFRPAENM